MSQRAPTWTVDPRDPRAPPADVWDAMTPLERRAIVASLPTSLPEEMAPPPEGDPHRKPKTGAVGALDAFFKRSGRKVYVSSELATYYPGERIFAPDVLAVLDVETHDRERWVVADEGKGLDFVLEIHMTGDRKKDFERNVRWYAELEIPEYFLFDRRIGRLLGFRLARPDARIYEPILAQRGRLESRTLGLWLALEASAPPSPLMRLRFYAGTAVVPEPEELAAQLEATVSELLEQRADAEQRLADALAEIERLKRGPDHPVKLVVLAANVDSCGPVEIEAGERVLDVCDERALPILLSCRSANCGTCRVRVVRGAELLSAATSEEQALLRGWRAEANERLACQLVVTAGEGIVELHALTPKQARG